MPFSHSGQISTIVGFAEALDPQSVLDVGTGMGQYGFLLRNNLEREHLFEVDGTDARQRRRDRWRVEIVGIEGFSVYQTPVHAYAYDRMLIGDALAILPTIEDARFDLVLAIDILEHLDRGQGDAFLAHCRRVARRAALISTPKEFHPQQVDANAYENHRSVWSDSDLRAAGYTEFLADRTSWIAVCRN